MRIVARETYEMSGLSMADMDFIDLYSCFPSAVEIAAKELGISTDRTLTVYGGLCFAGGPWNNPVGHAIASMVGVLRDDPGSRGLVTANGGNVEKHAFGVYSTEPPDGGFRWERPQDEIDAVGGREVSETYEGSVTLEAWTVMHERDGSMSRAHAACLTPGGVRVWGVTDDADTMKRFESEDMVGAPGTIGPEGALDV
jgi:acetyl-CoA C-acetyltransferase